MRFLFSDLLAQQFSKLLAKHHIARIRSRLVGLIWRLLPTIFAIIITIPIVHFGDLQPIEFWAYNSFTIWRGDRPWDNRVAIIAIDDVSINKFGRFPWTRDRYIQLLQTLRQSVGNVIGFDILWSDPTAEDSQLAEAVGQSPVVLSMAWDKSGQALLPINSLSNDAVAIGHILKREDNDGIVRQIDLQIQGIPILGVAMLQAYALNTATIAPLPDLSQTIVINWARHSKDIPQFSFIDVIDGKIPAAIFNNKIILVGVTASGLDSLVTPFDRNPPSSGVHLHATILQNLLQKNSLTIVKDQDIWIMALVVSLLMSLVLSRRNLYWSIISTFVLFGLWLAIAFIFFNANYWLAISIPILMVMFTGLAITLQDRWQVQRSLKIANERLFYDANHDCLTGLFNRFYIEEKLHHLLDHRIPSNPNHNYLLAILWINIDRSKYRTKN